MGLPLTSIVDVFCAGYAVPGRADSWGTVPVGIVFGGWEGAEADWLGCSIFIALDSGCCCWLECEG